MAETPVDALRRRARTGLLESAERAPARAHFRAMGVDPARLGGPIIGVASTWKPPPPRYDVGVFARYRGLVSSASEGAVLVPLA